MSDFALAWCGFSKDFLGEYEKLAGHLYKMGELGESVFVARIDGDKENKLASLYGVDGFPSVFFEKYRTALLKSF